MLHVNVVVSQSQGREITQLPLFSPPPPSFFASAYGKKENCWGGRGPAIDGSDGSTFLTLFRFFLFVIFRAQFPLISPYCVWGGRVSHKIGVSNRQWGRWEYKLLFV